MNACIVLNGSAPKRDFFTKEVRGKIVIAADGGLALCRKYNVTPDYIVGDFDSVSSKLLATYQQTATILKDQNQDTTDFQKALALAESLNARHITVLGGFGKDVDHELANILALPKHAVMKSETSFAMLSRSVTFNVTKGSIVSVIAISELHGLSHKGLVWSAPKGKLSAGWIGIRNRANKKSVSISARRGMFAIIVHAV